MAIDMRREHAYHQRMLAHQQTATGEVIVWFCFDADNSEYHAVYDEGNRQYKAGLQLPVIWIDQIEDPTQYSDVGRRPTQRVRLAFSTRTALERGLPVDEVHGRRLWDVPPPPPDQDGRPISPWLDDRLNDILYYDGRYYRVSNFQIRGRMQAGDNIIGVSAIETQVGDEMPWDVFPWSEPTDTVPPEEP